MFVQRDGSPLQHIQDNVNVGGVVLFGIEAEAFESEKERNLYYKFFAGFLFNEFVDGLASRLEAFSDLLRNPAGRFGAQLPARLENFVIDERMTHVSFDNHAYLIQGVGEDRGEFADVMIHDRSARVLIAIEAKLYDNWTFDKDIASNAARLGRLRAALPDTTIIACLLIPARQWPSDAAKKTVAYEQLLNAADIDLTVILWEELLRICAHERVASYLRRRLATPKHMASYFVRNGAFRAHFAEYEAHLARIREAR